MDPNLTLQTNSGFKQILLKKLSCAVIASITSQIALLFLFVFMWNFNLMHPVQWFGTFFTTLTSFYTWIYMIPFSAIIFAQSVICAKDYVIIFKYSPSRFRKFMSIFSLHNFVLLILHVMTGGLVTWLYLELAGSGQYSTITRRYTDGFLYLNEGKFYLILCGLWSGLYYFLNMYASDKKIMFPVVYQYKLLQFKSQFFPIIRKSKSNAFWPVLYFAIFYYFFGNNLKAYVCVSFNLKQLDESGLFIYLVSWVFTSIFFVKMRLMSLFFELFLTEPVYFAIESIHKDDLILAQAIGVSNIPIIQHLACFDLYMLAFCCQNRRKQLFTLSQPGGHPHNWNCLTQNLLKIIADYTQELNKSSVMLEPEVLKLTSNFRPNVTNSLNPMSPIVTSPLCSGISNESRFRSNIRNMSFREPEPLDIINITQGNMFGSISSTKENISKKFGETLDRYVNFMKCKLGINFLFGELPEVNIQHCLGNGQIIIWTSQGLASLVTFALEEDTFGIAQKDLPVIITSLYDLKLSLEKLNRLPALSKRGSDDYNAKMKASINSAVKRSIFNICRSYGPYLKELNLKKEVLQYLQSVINSRSVG